jgi:Acetyltransferase (GNAT) domain
MRKYPDPNFLALSSDVDALFLEPAAKSFFNTPGWYDLVSRFGSAPGWRPLLITDDEAQAAFVLQSRGSGDTASCANPYTCEHAILERDNLSPAAITSLASMMGRRRFRIRLTGLAPGAPAFAAAEAGLRNAGFAVQPFFGWRNWFEDIRGTTFADFLTGRPSVLTNTWKRKSSALRREPTASFRTFRSDTDVEEFIAAYERAQKQSWKTAEPFPQFIPELIRHLAKIDAFRGGVLMIRGQPAAAQFWIVRNGKALIFKLVHDEAFKEFSPGTLLTMHMIEKILSEDAPDEIDFGRGDDGYKKLWVNMSRERWGIEAVNPRTITGALLATKMLASKSLKMVRH